MARLRWSNSVLRPAIGQERSSTNGSSGVVCRIQPAGLRSTPCSLPNATMLLQSANSTIARMLDVDELLALDLLTLREHTELAGDILDAGTQRGRLEQSLETSEVVAVRRAGALIAYAMLRPEEDGRWFVLGFNTHPDHRNANVFRELFAQISSLSRRCSITALRSNVYKTNRLSMAFHRRLGFRVSAPIEN
jgi:ribosomal protein S18 acetylase RimI-like enzyme